MSTPNKFANKESDKPANYDIYNTLLGITRVEETEKCIIIHAVALDSNKKRLVQKGFPNRFFADKDLEEIPEPKDIVNATILLRPNLYNGNLGFTRVIKNWSLLDETPEEEPVEETESTSDDLHF